MSILVRMTAAGMTKESYDAVSEHLTPLLEAAPGFKLHVAFLSDDGAFHVSEVWQSRADFDNWYENNVKPNVPGVAVDSTHEVHNVIAKK
ncbi:MAG: antibiotic biosynthesis monooxygenase [Acidimicrobiales bacterium]